MEQTAIQDLKPGMKNLNITFIILEIGQPITTKEGHVVRTCKVADRSASINISVWDEPGLHIQPGDICKLTKGYASLWKGCLTLYTGKGGDIQKIGEFCMLFSETPNMSEPNPEYMQQIQVKLQGGEQRRSPTLQQPITTTQTVITQGMTPTGNGLAGQPSFNQRGPRPSVFHNNQPARTQVFIVNHNNGTNSKPRPSRR
ncbi:SOSS complex subunit B1 [Tachypleus tridentatus]|uniref:SOSS complex subunit B1 n=1 Tax=Tachypleus tridentatus TaxID=6853 RepID=UPI003FD3601D